jgi:uncharacterized protein
MSVVDDLRVSPPALAVEPGPVAEAERIDSLDVLRGFALLGILVMNIQAFSMIEAAYNNPMAYGEIQGADFWVWLISHVLFDLKFMTIFTMLFGAGIILMAARRRRAGRGSAGIHYRRMGVLLLFGLLHAYLLWYGDILYFYAMCGLWVYLFRNWRPSVLISVGLVLIAIPTFVSFGLSWSMAYWPADSLEDFVRQWAPTQEKIDWQTAVYQGGWWDQMSHRPKIAFMFETFAFFLWMMWRVSGVMFIGIALFKLEVFSAKRSTLFYATMIIGAVVVGLPLILLGVHGNIEADWNAEYSMLIGSQYNYWASILVSLGWVGVVMLICRHGRWHRITRPFAAVGRMAFTNYLMQSVICTTIFYGHGLGLYGKVSRVGQIGVVLGVWAFLLILSPIWLRRYHFGPMEWLWRSLTYRQLQPMRRRPCAALD